MSPQYRPYAHAWEAIYTDDFSLDQIRRRCITLAKTLAGRNLRCLISYDTRFMSNLLAREAATTLQQQQIPVILAPAPTPLPAIHHALDLRITDCALYISARNRPHWYNGLVLIARNPGGLSIEPDAEAPQTSDFPQSEASIESAPDLRALYLDALRTHIDLDQIRRTSMTIFVDAMNGTSAGMIPALLGEGGQTRAVEINREPDPLFGRTTPLPTESVLTRLKKLVRESDSHLGLALSADGTALAVVDKNGEQLDSLETTLLLSRYLARQQRSKGIVVAPTPTAESALAGISAKIGAWEEASGLKLDLTPDPAQRINELISQERPTLFLGSMATGEILVRHIARCPDATLVGLLVAEMAARNGGSLRSLIDAQRELAR